MIKTVYTAQQVADLCDIPLHTLRYYIKIGLLPFSDYSAHGQRRLGEKDIAWIKQLQALKRVGLSLKEIRQYVEWLKQGDETIAERLDLFEQKRLLLLKNIVQLQADLAFIEQKCAIYRQASSDNGDNLTAQCLAVIA